MIYLGSDHRGFELKQKIKEYLKNKQSFSANTNLSFEDLGDFSPDPSDDYVDFVAKVAQKVLENEDNKGILLCGSGVGVDIAANKFDGIRSALVYDKERAVQSRQHEDINVLSLPADVLSEDLALEIVGAFLDTEFSEEERHIRRLSKIEEIEEMN